MGINKGTDTDGKELLALRYLQRQKDTLASIKAALSDSEKENIELRRQVELLQQKGRKKLQPKKPPASKGKRAFILGLTDNHYTQQVDPTLSGGENLHNEKISFSRVSSVVSQANEIIEQSKSKYGVSEALIWLGGDSMVNADLHPNFQRLTPYEPLEELEVVYNIKMALFDQIRKGPLRRVPLRVHGSLSNHGRDGKKEEVSAEIACRRSYDVALYKQLERSLGLPFHIEQTYWGVDSIGGVKCLLHHGHMISMKVMPNTNFYQPNWTQLGRRLSHPKHKGVKLAMIGHWHTAAEYQSNEFVFVSAGCTVGQDGYAYGHGFLPEKPSQPLIEINSENEKVVQVHRIYTE